jgi:hypothetical protein
MGSIVMPPSGANARRWPHNRLALIALAAGSLMAMSGWAIGQDAQPGPGASPPVPPAAEPQPAPPASPPGNNPGLIQEIGRLFERGAATITDPLGNAKRQMDEINQNATTTGKNIGDAAVEIGKTATGVVVAPLASRVISGHETCQIAPNGAPDCVRAAETMCRKSGFRTGQSIDFTSAQQCSPKAYLTGAQNASACTGVTFVTRAMCQ